MRTVFLEKKPPFYRDFIYSGRLPLGRVIVVNDSDLRVAYFGLFGVVVGENSHLLNSHSDVVELAREEGFEIHLGQTVGGCSFRIDGQIIQLGGKSRLYGPINDDHLEELHTALKTQGFEVTANDGDGW